MSRPGSTELQVAMKSDVMGTVGAAEYLDTTVRHIRALVYRKSIPYSKKGKYLAFRVADLDAWLGDNGVEVRDR